MNIQRKVLPSAMALVSDVVESSGTTAIENERTLEMSDPDTRDGVLAALRSLVPTVFAVNSPRELIDIAYDIQLVLTIYGGMESRNRMALVPAVCETLGIQFMGADTYARILCQDKYLSKIVAREIGLDTAPALLVRDKIDLPLISGLSLPLVVKPNLEGSSIGIGPRNLVRKYKDAADLAEELLNKFGQPILVEEFVGGREVSYCVSGNENGINLFEAVEDVHISDVNFFKTNLYTAECKKRRFHEFTHRRVTDEVSGDLRATLYRLFAVLGKLDYVRIDCRVQDGTCRLIEITPDPYLGENGAFSDTFSMLGLTYAEGVALLISNSYRID
jgi:D-alanine-D-alanine ligase